MPPPLPFLPSWERRQDLLFLPSQQGIVSESLNNLHPTWPPPACCVVKKSRVYLKLVISKRVEDQVDSLALRGSEHQLLKAARSGVADVGLLQHGEGVQQELLLGHGPTGRKHLQRSFV